MGSPGGGDSVIEWELAIGMRGDVENGEIIRNEAVNQTAKGDGQEQKLSSSGRSTHRHPQGDAAGGTEKRKDSLSDRKEDGKDQAPLTDFCAHRW